MLLEIFIVNEKLWSNQICVSLKPNYLNFLILGVVHIIRNALGGGGQRFVTKYFKSIGICRVLCYEE
jgi:hypothetical protein